MSNVLRYKGYSARPEYSAEDQVFYGKILGIDKSLPQRDGQHAHRIYPSGQDAQGDHADQFVGPPDHCDRDSLRI